VGRLGGGARLAFTSKRSRSRRPDGRGSAARTLGSTRRARGRNPTAQLPRSPAPAATRGALDSWS